MIKKAGENGTLKSGVFMLTSACNLRCDYCFEYEHAGRNMSKETAQQGIRYLLSNAGNKVSIILFGGEPLMRKEFLPWIIQTALTEAKKMNKHIRFSLTTNGTLLDRETADLLKRGNVHIHLSADGKAEAHNVHRKLANKKGSAHLVEKAIPLIKDACPSPSVRMTITPENVFGMADGVEHFVNLGFNSVNPVPNIEAQWTPETFQLYAENVERVGALFIKNLLNQRYLKIYGITDVIKRANGPPPKHLCGAGRTMIAIDTDGSIFPCQRFIGYWSSNIKWKMGDIWEGVDEDKQDYFNNLTSDKVKSCKPSNGKLSAEFCQHCDIYHICAGGCPAVNELENGAPDSALPSYQVFKSICIDEVHSIITFLQSEYPQVWETYISRLSKGHKCDSKPGKETGLENKKIKKEIHYENF
jgi:uncharacterized protein